MADAAHFNITTEQEAQQVVLLAQASRPNDPLHGWRPKAEIASKQEVVWQGGEMTKATSMFKTQDAVTHYAVAPTRPGYIAVPGFGETTVEAAKAAGLIPAHWKEGDANPFADPAKGTQDKGTEAGTKDGKGGDLSVAEHQAKVAGGILDAVDKAHGSAVTDAMIERAVETGDLPLDMLPQGFSEVQMKQVHAGYIAQANAALATVGASVSLLESMMTDAELLQARRATLANSKAELAALGQMAVSRLAQLPNTDPEGFLQMVADMPPAERKCMSYDKSRQLWVVKIPGKPSMSYGGAVHAGFIRL
ncbi:hypothetical protein [Defluviimonas sp. WL0075]|uniref:Uncharacterized protein n=1 Tax=Albidovulum sediminicola TaxID=2984331 RepID=A0ABT2YWT1_9RHOB|nr:hypothetical protein [Defluviimonas sp. WL0075]MCV2863337.1 hypothetical protein [Defluviimonas sp. WL0075]